MLLWIIFATLYVVLLLTLGLMVLRNGHFLLFFIGLFLPFLWIIGAFMGPTEAVRTNAARANLR